MVELSLILPTHDRIDSLERAVASALDQDLAADRYEVLVVDNRSRDGTGERIRSLQARTRRNLRYVREERLGLHHARHAGAREARGGLLVFTDDDASFERGWLAAYAEAFAEHPRMAASGGPIRPLWEQPPPAWLERFIAGRKSFSPLSLMEPYEEHRLEPRGVFFGTNMAIRRDLLFELGGFNPEAFGDRWLGDGETGLNRKLWRRGLLVGYVPAAAVYHHIPAQRMTVSYLRQRMSNEGACDVYSRFHDGIPGRSELLHRAGALVLKHGKTWVKSAWVRGRKDRAALDVQLTAARTFSQLRYVLRLAFDSELRGLVRKSRWLTT